MSAKFPSAAVLIAYRNAQLTRDEDVLRTIYATYIERALDVATFVVAQCYLARQIANYSGTTLALGAADDAGNLTPADEAPAAARQFLAMVNAILDDDWRAAMDAFVTGIDDLADAPDGAVEARCAYLMGSGARLLGFTLDRQPLGGDATGDATGRP